MANIPLMPTSQAPMIGNAAPGSMISPMGVASSQGIANNPQLQGIMEALMKQKLKAKLSGQLPGTTAQSLGAGTAGGDAGAPALSLGGAPGPMNA